MRSAQALQRKGIKQVFSALKNSPAESRARGYGFDLLSFDDFSSLSTLLNLRQFSQKINPSHIICYGGQEDFLCRFLPQKIKKIRFYGQELPEYSTLARIKFSSFFEQHFYKLAPCFKIENQLKQVSNFKNIKTITLGLDSNAYLNAKESQKSERPIICIFGRLDPVKGHREFLKIFKKAMSLFPAHTRPLLRIVGLEANLKKQDLQKAIDHYSLSNDVDFILDRINAPSKLMSQCHLGIISSLGSETICRVAEEFLLSGTRIFVSGVGGLEDLLLEKSFGASYNSLNSDAAAQLLNNQLQLSIEETAEDKLARSAVAAKYFGLDEFGNKLLATLES